MQSRPIPMTNLPWLETRQKIEMGYTGYYIERGGFYDIVLPDAHVQCQIPSPAMFDELADQGLRECFNRAHLVDFETNWKPKLLRSNLSDR